ncbi:MAG TPA: hypothetical protein VNJ51_00305 [Candidatus Dormibacteraeota bacterium]|nr:hypothetical protein [Candidatus Dormibacteraeota bacterium]
MSETIHTEHHPVGSANGTNEEPQAAADARGAVIAGLVGAVVGAAGFLIYQRLPDEQKDRIHRQVRTLIDQKVNELRQNFQI